MRSSHAQSTAVTPPVLVTPPGGSTWTGSQFPGPPPSMNAWSQQQATPTQATPNVEILKKENEDLSNKVERLTTELNTLRVVSAFYTVTSCVN